MKKFGNPGRQEIWNTPKISAVILKVIGQYILQEEIAWV